MKTGRRWRMSQEEKDHFPYDPMFILGNNGIKHKTEVNHTSRLD